jgi:hypothetical protein
MIVGKKRQIVIPVDVKLNVLDAFVELSRTFDHGVCDIDSVRFAEVIGERPSQSPNATTKVEATLPTNRLLKRIQLLHKTIDLSFSDSKKLA